MECGRLNRLVRSWYVQVQEEALAPARMVEFMEKHLKGCDACLADPDVRTEVKKITDIVLPPSKLMRMMKEDEDEEAAIPYAAGEEDPEAVDDGTDDETDEEEDEFAPSMLDDEEDDDF